MRRERVARCHAWALIALVLPCSALGAASSAITVPDLAALEARPSPSAPLDLDVNGAFRRTVEVVLRDSDALVPVEDLELVGLQDFSGARETIDGRLHVSLASLWPSVRFEVDERALALRIAATPDVLGRRTIDLRSAVRPPGLQARGHPSHFLNYSVQYRSDGGATAFAEAGLSTGGRLLYSSGQRLADGTVVRGLSSVTFDDVPSLRRMVLGDAFAASTGLGGGVLLGGVSLVREYGLDPYFVRAPTPVVSGFAPTPSTLDVYVNGVLARQVPVPPGSYDVSNLPVTAGAGTVQTILRDAFGRAQVLDLRYYQSAGLLSPGVSDYGYAVGFRRLGYGRSSFDYGRPVFVGRHRLGIRDRLTLGARLDAALDLVSGGPSATIGLPFGTLDLEAAASAEGGGALGIAGSIGYGFVSRRFSGGAFLRVLGDRYAHAAMRAADDRTRLHSSVFAGAPLGSRLHLSVDWSRFDRRDGGLTSTFSARSDLHVAKNLTVGVTGRLTRSRGAAPAHDLFATLSWTFAPMSVADGTVQAAGTGTSVSGGVQRGLPSGTGLGYRVRTGYGPSGETAAAALQYQWEHGRYDVEYDRFAGRDIGTATVAGSVVTIADRFFLSRPVQQGYGLIRVGVPGVRGFAEGQEIGRTDARGDLLVPQLLPYYGNRLAIADRDVPIAYRIGETERLAAPTHRGGVVVRFEVEPLRVVEGALLATSAGGERPPAYGELTVRGAAPALSSPIGGDGRFYLEGLPSGVHAAEVEWSGGRCRAMIVVPESPPLVDLGVVRCHPDPLVVEADGVDDAAAPSPASSTPAATATSTSTATHQPRPRRRSRPRLRLRGRATRRAVRSG